MVGVSGCGCGVGGRVVCGCGLTSSLNFQWEEGVWG